MWQHHERAWIWHGVEMRCPGRSRMGRDSLTPRRRNRSGYFRMWRRRGRWEMWQLRAGESERASQPWASRIWQRRRPWGLYPAFRSMRRRSAGHRYVKVVVANAWSVRENELASRSRDRCGDGRWLLCSYHAQARDLIQGQPLYVTSVMTKLLFVRPQASLQTIVVTLFASTACVSPTFEFSLKVLSSLPKHFSTCGRTT